MSSNISAVSKLYNQRMANQQSGHNNAGENFTSAQKNINSAILEYLLKYGFMKTIDLFQVLFLINLTDITLGRTGRNQKQYSKKPHSR